MNADTLARGIAAQVTSQIGQAGRPEPMAYRVNDACHALGGIGRTSLYDLIKSGELKIIKIAGRTMVPRSEIERLTSVDRAA